VDLFVVPARGTVVDGRAKQFDGIPVQLNVVTHASLEEYARTFDAYRVTPSDRSQLYTVHMQAGLKAVTRLAFGRPLHASPVCEAAYSRIDQDVLRQLVMTECARQVARNAEDAAGAMAVGDPLIALSATAAALHYACETILAAHGDVYLGDSFFWRRLARLDPEAELARTVWHALPENLPWGADSAAVRRRAEDGLHLASHLASHALLDGWTRRLVGVPPYAPQVEGARRNPFFTLLRFGDTITFAGPDKAFRTTEQTARLWLDDARPAAATRKFIDLELLLPAEREVEGR
ncbi:MAG TPA: hypothetical protein VFM37_04120, partial [Pseudonocardiaceae bacterium]|nr:hypothetical protein [Pseudonocardiaceae bacterium]